MTSTRPAVPAGDGTVISVADTTVKPVAGLVPKWTALAPVNPVPPMLTEVPPEAGPTTGLTELTAGAAS